MVIVCHTECIWTTGSPGTGIHTMSGYAIWCWSTDLIVTTICVIRAFGNGCTANCCVVRVITLKSWGTHALAKVTNSIGPTLYSCAKIINFFLRFSWASLKWISNKVKLTSTVKASWSVDANSIKATNISSAFIEIKASIVGVACNYPKNKFSVLFLLFCALKLPVYPLLQRHCGAPVAMEQVASLPHFSVEQDSFSNGRQPV